MQTGTIEPIARVQLELNAKSAHCWDVFGSHRAAVTNLLLDASVRANGQACILGAGNCNDIALRSLTAIFDSVHLVDIDAAAIRAGISRQFGSDHHRSVWSHTLDVTGAIQIIQQWSPGTPIGRNDIRACVDLP